MAIRAGSRSRLAFSPTDRDDEEEDGDKLGVVELVGVDDDLDRGRVEGVGSSLYMTNAARVPGMTEVDIFNVYLRRNYNVEMLKVGIVIQFEG